MLPAFHPDAKMSHKALLTVRLVVLSISQLNLDQGSLAYRLALKRPLHYRTQPTTFLFQCVRKYIQIKTNNHSTMSWRQYITHETLNMMLILITSRFGITVRLKMHGQHSFEFALFLFFSFLYSSYPHFNRWPYGLRFLKYWEIEEIGRH